jgi:uncharacterized protein (TIGR01777 family)
MSKEQFIYRTRLPYPAAEVWQWHVRAGAFERYNPPWDPAEILESAGGVAPGSRAVVRVNVPVFGRTKWVAEHVAFEDGKSFVDVQREGPFAFWEHTHRVEPDGGDACFLEDRIEYTLPMGTLGRMFGSGSARRQLEQVFRYRHALLAQDLSAHANLKHLKGVRVLVSGASGLVGSALVPFLSTGGHRITRLVRSTDNAKDTIAWNPATRQLDVGVLEGFDAVVHLAGENIAGSRWNAEVKQRIRDSRIQGTQLLSETIAKLERPPRVFVVASAIGYYGNRGDEMLTEESAMGTGFLAEVCRDWEAAAAPARQRGIRVVHLRFGVILSPRGGALAQMLTPFRLGAGGVLGPGSQYMSWITLDDAVGAIAHVMDRDNLAGPVNVTAPEPLTNRQFTKIMGSVLYRPTIAWMPAFGVRLMFGEMADELLLSSARVQPRKLIDSGYAFRHPDLARALRFMLGMGV